MPHPGAEGQAGLGGGGFALGEFVVAEPDVDLVAAGVVDGRAAGSGRHVSTIAETVSLDRHDFMGDNKS